MCWKGVAVLFAKEGADIAIADLNEHRDVATQVLLLRKNTIGNVFLNREILAMKDILKL